MTAGVQMTGMLVAGKAAAGARSTGRTGANGSAFADMVSSNLSSAKDTASAQPKAEPQGNGRVDAGQKAGAVSDAKEPVMATDKEPAVDTDVMAEKNPEGENLVDGQMPQEDGQTPEESGALDTQFPKSLKLFKEAARLLEAQKLGELKQAIMDSLNIDEEELKKILEQLGVNMQELMQPQILQQVVVQAQGAGDPAILLTDETAMNSLKELLAKAEELMADMPKELTADAMEEMLPEREVTEAMSEFEAVLDEAGRQQGEIAAEQTKEPGLEEKTVDAPKAPAGQEPKFSFVAVKESAPAGEAQENSQDARSGAGDTKSDAGSMAEQFLNLVTNAASKEEVEFSQLSRSEQVREVAQQIIERVRVFVGEAQSSMEISLTPESLGRVTLNLVSRQGALTAHFTAQNQIAKEAIESQIVVLRENLESQGLKVEAIEVTVSNFDFMQNGGQAADGSGQGGRQRRRGVTFDEAVNAENAAAGMKEAEEIAADMRERSGNQVDYTA